MNHDRFSRRGRPAHPGLPDHLRVRHAAGQGLRHRPDRRHPGQRAGGDAGERGAAGCRPRRVVPALRVGLHAAVHRRADHPPLLPRAALAVSQELLRRHRPRRHPAHLAGAGGARRPVAGGGAPAAHPAHLPGPAADGVRRRGAAADRRAGAQQPSDLPVPVHRADAGDHLRLADLPDRAARGRLHQHSHRHLLGRGHPDHGGLRRHHPGHPAGPGHLGDGDADRLRDHRRAHRGLLRRGDPLDPRRSLLRRGLPRLRLRPPREEGPLLPQVRHLARREHPRPTRGDPRRAPDTKTPRE